MLPRTHTNKILLKPTHITNKAATTPPSVQLMLPLPTSKINAVAFSVIDASVTPECHHPPSVAINAAPQFAIYPQEMTGLFEQLGFDP